MKNKLFISDREKEALINYLSGNFNADDSSVLDSWLSKNKQNKLLFDQFSDVWQASYYSHFNKKIDVQTAWTELQAQIQKKSENQIQWKRWLQIAAVVTVSFLVGGLGSYFSTTQHTPAFKSQMVEYVVPLGARSFIKLNDGSKVWLNSGTTIKYENTFGLNNRNIDLSGEAFFEVAKNEQLPFIVNTGEISVTAVGTKFNVKAYKEEKTTETTLIEGSVKLNGIKVKLADNLILKPNEKAVYTKRNRLIELSSGTNSTKDEINDKKEITQPKLQVIESIEPEAIISWKEKRWIIRNEKLGSLSVKLERRYNVNFIFDNEILKEYSFGGTLEDETLEQILNAISFAAPIKYVIDGKTVYIMGDGQKMKKFKNLLME